MMSWLGFRLRDAAAFFAAVVLCCAPLLFSTAPASAQSPPQSQAATPEVSLEYFHERLTPFGQWLNHPVWGEVWQPDAGPNFRPYFYGYWDYTSDYGSLWVSNEPYGDIVYHYGRWVFDMNYGWLWVPGYVWGPSWVVWRANQDYVGWLPMPPGYLDYDQPLISAPYAADSWYGYQTFYGPVFVSEYYYTLWVFVEKKDFGRSNRRRYVTDLRHVRDLYHGSNDRTNYVNARDRIVDRFIDRDWLRNEAGRDIEPRPAKQILRRIMPMTTVSEGREIFRHRPNVNPSNGDPLVPNRTQIGAAVGARTNPNGDAAATPQNGSPRREPANIPQFPGRSKFVRAPGVEGPIGEAAPAPASTPAGANPAPTVPQRGVATTGAGIGRRAFGRAAPYTEVPASGPPAGSPASVLPSAGTDPAPAVSSRGFAAGGGGIARRAFGRVAPYTDGTAGVPTVPGGSAVVPGGTVAPGVPIGVGATPPAAVPPSAPTFAPGRYRFAVPGGAATLPGGAISAPNVPSVSPTVPAIQPPVAVPSAPSAPAPAPHPAAPQNGASQGGAVLGRHFFGGL